MNVAEVLFGIELMASTKQKQRAMAMFRRLRRKPLLRITRETVEIFGRISAQLTQGGRGGDFRIQDLWLASQAIQRDFTLLTANAKDFKDIPRLKFVTVKVP